LFFKINKRKSGHNKSQPIHHEPKFSNLRFYFLNPSRLHNGGFGNEDNGGIVNEEENDRGVLNEYLLERMRLDDVGGEDDDELSVGVGPGGGGADEAEAVANESVDVAVAAVKDD
jgi:hypothetical protein